MPARLIIHETSRLKFGTWRCSIDEKMQLCAGVRIHRCNDLLQSLLLGEHQKRTLHNIVLKICGQRSGTRQVWGLLNLGKSYLTLVGWNANRPQEWSSVSDMELDPERSRGHVWYQWMDILDKNWLGGIIKSQLNQLPQLNVIIYIYFGDWLKLFFKHQSMSERICMSADF